MKERRLVPDGKGGRVEIDDEWLKCFTCGDEIVVESLLAQRNARIAAALEIVESLVKTLVARKLLNRDDLIRRAVIGDGLAGND